MELNPISLQVFATTYIFAWEISPIDFMGIVLLRLIRHSCFFPLIRQSDMCSWGLSTYTPHSCSTEKEQWNGGSLCVPGANEDTVVPGIK